MSEENVETVKRAVAAWNADDLDALLIGLDADIEWHPSIQPGLEGKEAAVFRGHEGARKSWREFHGETWESLKKPAPGDSRPRRFSPAARSDGPHRPGDRHRVQPGTRRAH